MKARLKSIGLAMACAIAASTASADLKLKWFGEQDGNWWTTNNWWDTSAETAEGYTYHEGYPGAYLSSDFSDDYSFPSIEFGYEINSNPGELDLNWSTLITSHTTIDLGGSARPIEVSGDIKSSYDGRKGWGGGDYDGGPITLTNGTINVGGKLAVVGNQEHFAVLQLKDVTLTCKTIELYNDGASKSKLILDGDTSVTAYWFGCSYKGSEEGCVELNGGTLNIPTFSYVNEKESAALRYNPIYLPKIMPPSTITQSQYTTAKIPHKQNV